MQNPVGSRFNPDTMRMEVVDFYSVLFNPVAQAKFVHTVSAGYVTASVFVLGISAWYLLRGRYTALAKRSLTVAAAFGLASSLSVVVLGVATGLTMEFEFGMNWSYYSHYVGDIFGAPPTRSLTGQVQGINELVLHAQERIESGKLAYGALEDLKADRANTAARATFEANRSNLGYAMLLKRYVPDPRNATADQVMQAAWDTVPNVPVTFWLFRLMAGLGFFFIGFFALAFYYATVRRFDVKWFLRAAVIIMPLPWLAAEMGWVLAEYGRQPWAIEGVLPTFLGASSLTVAQVWTTIAAFTLLYSALAFIEVRLMLAAIRKGPESKRGRDLASGIEPTDAGYAPLPAE